MRKQFLVTRLNSNGKIISPPVPVINIKEKEDVLPYREDQYMQSVETHECVVMYHGNAWATPDKWIHQYVFIEDIEEYRKNGWNILYEG